MNKTLKKILSVFNKKPTERAQRLSKILLIAEKIHSKNPSALKEYVQLLGRKLQSDYMCRAVSILDEHSMPNLEVSTTWFNELAHLDSKGTTLNDLKIKINEPKILNLASDLILPWPWNINRVVDNLAYIGESRPC
jgi:hypothetical protein